MKSIWNGDGTRCVAHPTTNGTAAEDCNMKMKSRRRRIIKQLTRRQKCKSFVSLEKRNKRRVVVVVVEQSNK